GWGCRGAGEGGMLEPRWPGNVRERRNGVEGGLRPRGPGALVELRGLPALQALAGRRRRVDLPGGPLADAVRGYERGLIVAALEKSGGGGGRGAQLLGHSRTHPPNKPPQHGLLQEQTWEEGRHNN